MCRCRHCCTAAPRQPRPRHLAGRHAQKLDAVGFSAAHRPADHDLAAAGVKKHAARRRVQEQLLLFYSTQEHAMLSEGWSQPHAASACCKRAGTQCCDQQRSRARQPRTHVPTMLSFQKAATLSSSQVPTNAAGAPAQPARALHGFSQVGQAVRKVFFGAPRQVDARARHARPQQPLQNINLRALQGTAIKQFSDVHD